MPVPHESVVVRPGGGACTEAKGGEPSRLFGADAHRHGFFSASEPRTSATLPAAGARTTTMPLGAIAAALCDVAPRSSLAEGRGKPGIALRREGSSDGRALHTFGRLTDGE